MNGHYPYDDPLALTRVKHKSAYVLPHRSRPAFQQDMNGGMQSANPPLSRVWNVVSNLVRALSDARDELLTLLTCDNSVRGGRPSNFAAARSSRLTSRSPSRSFSAPIDSRRSRSPTRGEGLGISSNSNSYASYDHQKPSHAMTTTNYSPPVTFGMNLEFEKVHKGRSPPVGNHDRRLSAGRYTTNPRGTPRNQYHGLDCFSTFPSAAPGERRRHCVATRYADLLKEETYHMRERRLDEEYLATPPSRPSWY